MTGKKKKGKKKAVILVLVILAAGAGGGFWYIKTEKSQAQTQPEVQEAQTATVSTGNISNTIVGTGTLELDDGEEVYVPSGIQIKKVYVESGDTVTEGQILASVDESSVLEALEDVQEEIQTLDEEINECKEDSDTETIKAGVSGRVKEIYVEEEDSVSEVMLEKQALMVLSIDGKMAVDLSDVTGVEEGDTVTVQLSDDTEIEGEVESVSEDGCTITVDDAYGEPEEKVTVTDDGGQKLGSGNLYIHQPVAVTGTTGTVSTVNVSVDTEVSQGTKLLTIEETEGSTKYQELLAQREEKTDTLNRLLKLEKEPVILATQDGTVEDVNVASSTSSSTTGTSSESGEAAVNKMSYTEEEITLESLGIQDSEEFQDGTQVQESVDSQSVAAENQTAVLKLAVSGNGSSNSAAVVIPVPQTGNTPVSDVSAADGSYLGSVTWNPADIVFKGEESYQALVLLTAGEGYSFTADSITSVETGTVSGVHVSEDGKTLEFQIAFPKTQGEQENGSGAEDVPSDNSDAGISDGSGQNNSGTTENNSGAAENAGTSQDNNNSQNGNNAQSGSNTPNGSNTQNDNNTQNGNNAQTGNGTTQSGGNASGQSSGGSGMSASGGSISGTASTTAVTASDTDTAASNTSYSTEVTAFTIAPDKNMLLSVNVDELDINSVETGQEAAVTLDAIEDEEFTGTVTKIGQTASGSGGVAKYTVVVTIPKDSRMRQGMNASATITIESRENVLTIPMNALQERGNKVFVYTSQDEDGNLSGEQEVTTGLSDGDIVEITDGLKEGDQVYYIKTGNTSGSSSGFDMSGFGGGDMDFGGGPGGNMDFSGGPGNSSQGGPDGKNAGGMPSGN